MKVAFWGTPGFAVPSLRALLGEGFDVVAVITQPDRPAGRGRKLRPSAVKEVALREDVPVLSPERPRGDVFRDTLRALAPDLSVVVAYGHILVPEVLALPSMGSWNVHASLLPELRGAAPVNWALIRGYDRTGITVMRMTEGMDEGPILLQRGIPIAPDDTATNLYLRLAELGAEALVETLSLLEVGALNEVEQHHERATYAPKLDRSSARIDWARAAEALSNHIRGMDAVPGAWTTFRGEPLKLFRPRPLEESKQGLPGEVISADPEKGLVVQAQEGQVVLEEAQPAGRRRMKVRDWLHGGGGPSPGDRFE